MQQIIPYNKNLKHFARKLRKEMTDSERLLWNKIRRKQILNVQFLRQKIVGSFILDFYSKEPKIAIEVDGEYHFTEQNKKKDANRDVCLSDLGICMLRFTNCDVLRNCDKVVFKIKRTILALTSPRSLPRGPLQRGQTIEKF